MIVTEEQKRKLKPYLDNPDDLIQKDYLIDDRPKSMCPRVAAMSDEEAEAEFQRIFGKYLIKEYVSR